MTDGLIGLMDGLMIRVGLFGIWRILEDFGAELAVEWRFHCVV